jgi:putative Mg2+ transporter-C (MgtC) family protein
MLLLRVVAAAALAAVLGWERERAGKAAGLRTHMLVGLAAALYTALGQLTFSDYHGSDPDLRADPLRVIQAVALGVGFLGGGAITASHGTGRDSGLTTAASIWSTAAIGIATGMGHSVLATGATALQLVVVWGLYRLERSVE